MGAGSKHATDAERKQFYNEYHPSTHESRCSHPFKETLGIYHFLNTGEPYALVKCLECKREGVEEL